MRTKRIELFILAVLLPLLLSAGCWDAKEIENKKIATLVIVDKTEQGYSFFVEFVRNAGGSPSGSGQESDKSKFVYLKASGETLAQAREALEAKTNRQIYLGAVGAVLLTEKMAKEGIAEYIYRLRQDNNYRKVVDVIITGEEPEAFETVEAGVNGVGMTIESIIQTLNDQGEPYHEANMGDVLEALASEQGCFLLPTVGFNNNEIEIIGLSVFEGEKLKGFIPWQESRGIKLLKGEEPEFYCVVPYEDIEATLKAKLTKRKLIPTYAEGKIGFQVKINFDAELAYINEKTEITEEDTAKLKTAFEQQLKQEIEETIRVSQQDFQCDYLGFYTPFRIKYPVESRQMNWKEMFPQAVISVEVTVRLDTSGNLDFKPQYDFEE